MLTNKLIELNQTQSRDCSGYFFKKHSDIKTDKYYLEGFAKLIISHAYLSVLFDCWVENIPSVANLDERNNQQQCLGTFIVGYKQDQEITDDERALFRITSDRISSNLAAETINVIHAELRYKQLRKQQHSILAAFQTEVLTTTPAIDHGSNSITQEHVAKKNVFFEKYPEDVLDKCGLKHFKSYVEETFKENKKIHKGIYTCFYDNKRMHSFADISCVYVSPHSDKNTIINIPGMAVEPHVNIVLVHNLIKVFMTEYRVISREAVENAFCVKINFNGSNVCLLNLVNSLKAEHKGEKGKVGSLGQFFIDNYEDFRIIGNLQILDDKNNLLVDFEKDLTPHWAQDKIKKLELRNDKIVCKNYSELIYKILFKSL